MVPQGERGGGISWEVEMDIHALLYVKWASQVMLVVKNPPANKGHARDAGWIPGLRRSLGEGRGNPLQYSCLEHPMDRGAWWAIVR